VSRPGMAQAVAWMQEPIPESPTPREVRDAVAAVFEDPALQDALRPRGSPPQTLSDLLRWLWDQYTRLLDWLEALRISSPGLYWLTITLLLVILVLLVWHVCWTFSAVMRGRRPAASDTAEDRTGRVRRYADERRRAHELAGRGEYAQAARALLVALLALLDERRILRLARGWTNREILQRLARQERIRADLGEFGSAVEGACYGQRELRAEDFARVQAALERIVAQLGGEPRT
jgi:hypothetical protein